MPKILNKAQNQWLKYKQMREAMEDFRIEPDDLDYGPGPRSKTSINIVQFFNFFWGEDRTGNIKKQNELHLTDEILQEFCQNLTFEDKTGAEQEFKQLKKKAQELDLNA